MFVAPVKISLRVDVDTDSESLYSTAILSLSNPPVDGFINSITGACESYVHVPFVEDEPLFPALSTISSHTLYTAFGFKASLVVVF